ncbi:hypothetical protein IFR05_006013 [Cadophora sp. M221]|nr:hypothetical protein IFR05_006013 [Cadophora sp. M221]
MSALSTALFLEHPEVDPVFQKMSMEKTSMESARSERSVVSSEKHTSTFSKLGHKIAKAAKEHHKSVNSAFTAYYGLPVVDKKVVSRA